ncbi:MAG: hypothetical protein HDS30_07850 [Bacteroides sp.]|nr:hypothetical protein [Bacteroides sp.]
MRLSLTSLILFFTITANGQIGEWIAKQIKAEIQSELSSITNYNANNLGSFGTYLWDFVVNSTCESDLNDKAKEFEKFEIDRSFLDRVPHKYPNYKSFWTSYSSIPTQLYSHANAYYHLGKNISFQDIAGSKFNQYAVAYIDSLNSMRKIESLDKVLSNCVLDTLLNLSFYEGLQDSLFNDINLHSRLAVLLNNHPEAVRVYANSLHAPSLRAQPKHLLFWAVKADSHKNFLLKKQTLINPRSLKFVQRGTSIDIMDGQNVIAHIDDDNISVIDINILNLSGRPNTIYTFANNTWVTDKYGRVVQATQSCDINSKKKCKQKSSIKPKDYGKLLGDESATELAYFNKLEYGAPDVLLNVYFYEKNKLNKTALKGAKKLFNSGIKQGHTEFTSYITYSDNTGIPSQVAFENSNTISNSRELLTISPTQPDTRKFAYPVYKDKIRAYPKTNFVNPNNSTTTSSSARSKDYTEISTTSSAGSSNSIAGFGKYNFHGKIDGKYAVTMNLSFEDGTVTGTYYYDKYRRKMKINGNISTSGRIKLIEYEGTKATGEYVGEFRGNVFSGNFKNYASGKKMPFHLVKQ